MCVILIGVITFVITLAEENYEGKVYSQTYKSFHPQLCCYPAKKINQEIRLERAPETRNYLRRSQAEIEDKGLEI